MTAPLVFRDVEKQYGGLRPLRVRQLEIQAGSLTMLLGFDPPAAEMFVNLVTGTVLPEKGAIVSLGRDTSSIADSADWLAFAERFGLVSERSVMLDAMTVAQNLALPFDLNIDAISAGVRAKVDALAREVDLPEPDDARVVGELDALSRARVQLARALALSPELLILEHPSARLTGGDVAAFARTIARIAERRQLTTVGLLADEAFARASGGRLLHWQPATGDFRERTSFRFW